MTTCTFYVDHSAHPCANGLSCAANRRKFGHYCASNRYSLGSRLQLTSRGGGRISAVVVDRIGHGTELDTDPHTFRVLAGPRWRIIGRLSVHVKLLERGRPFRGKAGRRGRR